MHRPDPIDAIAPTVPAPVLIPPAPRSRPIWPWASGTLVMGLALGLAIGLAAAGDPGGAETAETPEVGALAVSSEPAGSVVLVDGRVVGLTPLERIELVPGRHSIVIDLYGYHPYLGTLTIGAGDKAGLDAHLAAIGDDAGSRGALSGAGTIVSRRLPRSALASPPQQAEPEPVAKKRRRRASRPSRPPPRDCRGAESACRRSCDRARTDCDFACPTCSSCLNTMGWPECRRRCEACRQGCQGNLTFCRAQCDTARSQCDRDNASR